MDANSFWRAYTALSDRIGRCKKRMPLSDVVDSVFMGTFVGARSRPGSNTFCIIEPKNFREGGRIEFDGRMIDSVDPALFARKKTHLQPGDILISARGELRIAMFMGGPFNATYVTIQGVAVIRPKEDRLSSEMLYAALTSRKGWKRLQSLLRDSTTPYLTIGDLKKFKLNMPHPDTKALEMVEYYRSEAERQTQEMQDAADAFASFLIPGGTS